MPLDNYTLFLKRNAMVENSTNERPVFFQVTDHRMRKWRIRKTFLNYSGINDTMVSMALCYVILPEFLK